MESTIWSILGMGKGPWGRPCLRRCSDAEAASAGGFSDYHAVGEPSGVRDFADDFCRFELLDLLDDECLLLGGLLFLLFA